MNNDCVYGNCRQCLPSLEETTGEITDTCLQTQTNTTNVKHGTGKRAGGDGTCLGSEAVST